MRSLASGISALDITSRPQTSTPIPAMIPPLSAGSSLFQVEQIPNSGRGVVAQKSIPKGTVVLESSPPVTHVIFRQYRKEVCARCFRYDLGRTLPMRHASTGKVFCSAECQHGWLEEEGELGVKAWESLHVFVQARMKAVANACECLPDRGGKPGDGEIEAAWKIAEEQSGSQSTRGGKKGNSNTSNATVDPDILGYLLPSILSHHRSPRAWLEEITVLAQDTTPYRSTHDLSAHTDSYLHLSTLLPKPLLTSCTPSLCHLAVTAASHNSFGIRSPDGEEYMGYALYPTASYFNHSCEPNISKARVGRQWIFQADRNIAVGEECCITYMGGDEKDMSRVERRARLQEHWGFTCMCFRCLREDDGSA